MGGVHGGGRQFDRLGLLAGVTVGGELDQLADEVVEADGLGDERAEDLLLVLGASRPRARCSGSALPRTEA
ncbi:hypothetical protein ADK52_30585 [Streptomyces sp. WM6372]|uniref:hypothetical protein n=1 Tax=Streptomyces sp. WM6372 TaxID=1415555 RepID=UPI0006AFBFC5|nr:hypothetical protein [Streptomyces sp. WM6372]KOU18251.1 hypothetical protein ADK52_30585 [Streptomyces sp. WM6372]